MMSRTRPPKGRPVRRRGSSSSSMAFSARPRSAGRQRHRWQAGEVMPGVRGKFSLCLHSLLGFLPTPGPKGPPSPEQLGLSSMSTQHQPVNPDLQVLSSPRWRVGLPAMYSVSGSPPTPRNEPPNLTLTPAPGGIGIQNPCSLCPGFLPHCSPINLHAPPALPHSCIALPKDPSHGGQGSLWAGTRGGGFGLQEVEEPPLSYSGVPLL